MNGLAAVVYAHGYPYSYFWSVVSFGGSQLIPIMPRIPSSSTSKVRLGAPFPMTKPASVYFRSNRL